MPHGHGGLAAARRATLPHPATEKKHTERFAVQLCDVLERGRARHAYENLLLVAPAEFMGALHRTLGTELQSLVIGEVVRDAVVRRPHEILSSLAEFVGAELTA